jgi:hypothetical protein
MDPSTADEGLHNFGKFFIGNCFYQTKKLLASFEIVICQSKETGFHFYMGAMLFLRNWSRLLLLADEALCEVLNDETDRLWSEAICSCSFQLQAFNSQGKGCYKVPRFRRIDI